MAFEYILFDLDGTLTDPYEGITKSVLYALESFGIHETDKEVLRSFIGPPLRESFRVNYGFDKKKAELAVLKYRERYIPIGAYENRVIEGVPETLQKLKDNGKKLYLSTSKPLDTATEIIRYFDLEKYFTFLGGADFNVGRDEKWQVIEYVFDNCNIQDRDKVVIVGDRKHDVIGGKKCGIKSIGVLCGYGDREELENAGADFIADDFADICNYIL
ncbi:MAG: HAD hydrolase-like protein [Eubacterium sp.]|nr:HAD hydrolase-like protein [Eubacterium sp.]